MTRKEPSLPDNAEGRWNKLAAAAQDGDQKSYAKLLREIAPYVVNVVRPALANPDWADDIAQDVLISVHKSLKTYSSDRPFKPWLLAIINFRKTDYLRKHYSTRTDKQVSADVLEFSANHVTKPAHAGEWKDIEAALEQLPEKQRAVFKRMRIEGYTAQEVAKEMDMTESAVKVSVHRSTAKLKEVLEQE